jgi:quercetin dioxygenase-like cupin family protein
MLPLQSAQLEGVRAKITKAWSPVDVVCFNDQVVRMAKLEGEYHWHKHDNEDEMFFCYDGEFEIQLRDGPSARLSKGDVVVVPKGTEHCPKADKPAFVLLFEPYATDTKGD